MGDEPVWTPDDATVAAANLSRAMRELGFTEYDEFHRWSARHRADFWEDVVDRVGVSFMAGPGPALAPASNPEAPEWFPEATLNIAASCFTGDPASAAILAARDGAIVTVSRGELRDMVERVAAGLVAAGYGRGDRIAIAMPMTIEAVAAYLGIVWIGAAVVSIADSFAPDEIATRLRITSAGLVITQDVVHRSGKTLPMYEKVVEAGASRAVVVSTGARVALRDDDIAWSDLAAHPRRAGPVTCRAGDEMNILFSSGTTGDPKAIPWSHLTAIKSVVDGYYHQDVHAEDIVAWPTNLGWMMGPWLIYASLVNGATMALYDDVPTGEGFGRFIQEAGVTILGVVPSLVSAWRASGCMEGLDWSAVRLFSSTGEPSNPDDMAYLMDLAGGKPVIEYCGGTEIGGAYISGTVLQPARPSQFTTPTVGLDFVILDDEGHEADSGELFLIPPSIGLSTTLLNRDHTEEYFEGTPRHDGVVLRRHGDSMERLPNGNFRALGRTDDTMNLGGIKVSSAEIERVVAAVTGVAEVAAVGVPPPGGGPSRLVVYCVAQAGTHPDAERLRADMQAEVRSHLNPLFKIHEVVVVDEIPRTASAKVMRRVLRSRHSGPDV